MKRIYNELNSENIKVYFVGQHVGICKEPYTVIRKGIQLAELGSNKVGIQKVDIILYTPNKSYIKAESYEDRIRQTMKGISFLRKTGLETPWIFDDKKEALTKSIEYIIQKELEV